MLPPDVRARGGFACPTFSSMEASKRVAWGTSAPAWLQAAYGLNLEGVCHAPRCAAKGQKIILPVGMTEGWSLAEGRLKQKCPEVCRFQ